MSTLTYPPAAARPVRRAVLFGLLVIGLGLALAWASRWADSLWGAVLLHVGMDLLILLPVAQSL